jgi:type VI secretion system protein ImpE
VRDNPTDVQRRTFLFELLCFNGDFDRAEKHLHLLAQGNKQTEMGAILYFSALHAERVRHDLFKKKEWPATGETRDFAGTIDGKPFESIVDADPRIGPRLELFAAGAYLWLPFEHIQSIETQAPKKLRDLFWIEAIVRTGPSFKDKELGQVLIPVQYPFSGQHPNEAVRLGRMTDWVQTEDGVIPAGQKMFLADDEEFSLLDVRKIEFTQPEEQASDASAD